ncbi:DMT family transporter [Mammaliicoccus fleurettii]|uniref:DMT family transporter n=1 Tax=unclassified Mammaliicoccus TaxID=2803851 RepID=UPI000E69A840|nr:MULTISPECIES: DMT family transporter [unclassified Mammaliicoccus]RIL48329.1 DMT family transporter [Mammaliicoccus fleurettii]
MILLIILGVVAGLCVPLQTSINTKLGSYTKSPILSSFYSFLIGTIVLIIVNLIMNPQKLSPSFMMNQDFSYVWFTGGLLGVVFLTGNLLLLPRIGAALTVVMTVSGQIIMGIFIDQFGLFNADIHPINLERIAGVIIMLLGILLMNYKKSSDRIITTKSQHTNYWMVLGIFTGCLPPIQTAINSALRYEVQSFYFSALISFAIGTIALFILSLLLVRRIRFSFHHPDQGTIKPLYFIGGALGVVFVTTNILLMPELGAALTLMVVIFGQMLMGLLIDHFGLFNTPKFKITARRLIGATLVFIGIVILKLF